VSGTGGCPDTTATDTVIVTAAPNAGTLSGNQFICRNSTSTFTSNGTAGGSWSSNNTLVATVDASTGVVTGVSAGQATISYTVIGTGGCANAAATRTITVRPFAGTLSGTQAICVGSTSAFTSNGTAGGSWSSNNTAVATVNATSGVVTGVSAGTATISYTVSGTGGCPNATATRTVTVAQGVSITIQPVDTLTIVQNGNGSISVVASGASSYQWQEIVLGGTWTNLSNGVNYSGVSTASLSINSATTALNNNRYRVVITPSASACPDVFSDECSLIIIN
jgi:uncharacterized protein YjdB